MKKEKQNNRYIISRKILYLSIIILIPIILLLIYVVNGFVVNRVSPEIKNKFEVSNLNYVKPNDFNDFKINFEVTKYKEASKDSSGSLTWKVTYNDNQNTSTTNLKIKVIVADYWSDYTSAVSTKEVASLNKTSSNQSGTITLDYEHKNGWGVSTKVSNKPDIYVSLTYTYLNESQILENDKNVVLTYKFNEVSPIIEK